MSIPVGLESLIAQQEITNLCYRYARGSDRLDAKSFAAAFWDDGVFNQLNSGRPMPDFAHQLLGIMGQNFALTHHLNGNILIDFVDEDHATTEVYFRAFHLTNPEMTEANAQFLIGERRLRELSHVDGNVYDIVVGGRYLDQVERRDRIWKIKSRRLIFDYCTVEHSAALRMGEGMTAMGAGMMARDQTDPSYLP